MKLAKFIKIVKPYVNKSRVYSTVYEIAEDNSAVFTNGMFLVRVKIDETMTKGVYNLDNNLPNEVVKMPNYAPLIEQRLSLTNYDRLLDIGAMVKRKSRSPIVSLDGKIVNEGRGIMLHTLTLICDLGCSSLGVTDDGNVYASSQERDVLVFTLITK